MKLVAYALTFVVLCCITSSFVSSEGGLLQTVKLRFFHDNITSYADYDLNSSSLISHPKFELKRPTVIYIPGWNTNNTDSETFVHIITAYLQRNDHNILVLNYEKLSQEFYGFIVARIPKIGKRLALALRDLYSKGLDHSRIHMIGYSLGAPIAAEAGRALQNLSYIIPRITGLDPALPFYGNNMHAELNKNDAKFVDIIHTDAGVYGINRSVGHADFYPNGGRRPQPACGAVLWQKLSLLFGRCPHYVSAHFYGQSVASKEKIFVGINRFNSSDTAPMGFHCPTTASGDYDLRANWTTIN
ncbi:Endothelial lipase [Pseudolycoriella hygida]|uniref:Endothelial lipase n=1 Tax=Pseudolycoriella hygida TaxID=35572 RepID=A0A9Q0RXT7_9DIPT|nr:Endothelial lipase [Pseudolycoriella hygida]